MGRPLPSFVRDELQTVIEHISESLEAFTGEPVAVVLSIRSEGGQGGTVSHAKSWTDAIDLAAHTLLALKAGEQTNEPYGARHHLAITREQMYKATEDEPSEA